MSLQSILDNDAINMLPKIKQILSKAENFEYSQIYSRTLREISNTNISIEEMSDKQLNKFQDKLVEIFKHFNWI